VRLIGTCLRIVHMTPQVRPVGFAFLIRACSVSRHSRREKLAWEFSGLLLSGIVMLKDTKELSPVCRTELLHVGAS
jgi:hypothetical protein